jgi:16S rRNA (cytosine967-C5)-methyltransferase
LSYPDWIVRRLFADLGPEDALAALEAANHPPGVTLRANRQRTTPDELAAELVTGGAAVEPGRLIGDALVVRGTGDPARLPAVAEGRATPQDQSSQAVVQLLDPQPGETIVDLAAAPGGKATDAGERVGPGGRVVAIDRHAGRARLIADATRRLGLANVFAVVADGTAPPVRPGNADRVVVDAPCSGLGVLARRADARFRVEESDVVELADLQRELVRAAVPLLRSGGTLVYSVCTLTADETTAVDAWAEAELSGVEADERPGPPWRHRGRGALLLPQDAGTDGMFVLRLRVPPS